MKKRILYVVWNLSRGGAQKVVSNIIRGLSEDYEPHLLYFNEDDLSLADEFRELRVKLHHFDNKRLSRRFKEFKTFIQSIKPDVVNSHLAPGFFSFYLFLWMLKIPKVYCTYHLVDYPKSKFEFITQFLIDGYVQVSKESSKKHSKRYHVLPSKQRVIYNGIDTKYIAEESSKTEGLDWENGIHVLGIANFHPQKGYTYALPAMTKLMEKYEDLHYHVLGDAIYTSEIATWIREFVDASPYKDRIHLHGQVSNVFPYCGKADIFFSATEKELMPVSLIEAMAAGLPVVYTITGGVPEVLGENSEYGVLIPPADIDAAVTALDKMISDVEWRNKYAEQAKKRAADFDISAVFSEYYQIYAE